MGPFGRQRRDPDLQRFFPIRLPILFYLIDLIDNNRSNLHSMLRVQLLSSLP